MFPDHSFFFQLGWILFHFRFVEEILLSRNVIGSSFAGRTKELFGQIIYLFLKSFLMTGFFVNNKTESFNQFRLLRIIVFSCDTVSFSSRSWISFALEAIVSLLGFDSFIIPEMGLLLKENNA